MTYHLKYRIYAERNYTPDSILLYVCVLWIPRKFDVYTLTRSFVHIGGDDKIQVHVCEYGIVTLREAVVVP